MKKLIVLVLLLCSISVAYAQPWRRSPIERASPIVDKGVYFTIDKNLYFTADNTVYIGNEQFSLGGVYVDSVLYFKAGKAATSGAYTLCVGTDGVIYGTPKACN